MKRSKHKSVDGATRLAILARDDWQCQRCGSAGPLHVHHVRRRSQGGPNVVDNLLTLCWLCHNQIHRMGQ